ncbi:MAG TPA: outer membrane lipoprotein carrier protein LolA [Terriglobales bacterium]|nr:outer membrane lipoprotein carrier protein LolA [Terriglobales bacterium]
MLLLRSAQRHGFRSSLAILSISIFSLFSVAQSKSPANANSKQPASNLEAVLTQMDAAAARFRSAEADFTQDLYQKVVNETDTQKGKVYFRRTGKGQMQMAANTESPDEKFVTFTDGKIRIYQPKINQINEYDAGKNRDEFQSFLVLGFGGSGHDLEKQFEVKLAGSEDVDGVSTAKLELTPKSAKVKNNFDRFIIWVDTSRDVSLKQQAFEPSGDYRLSHYTNIKLNGKIPDDVFKLHTAGGTKTVKGT